MRRGLILFCALLLGLATAALAANPTPPVVTTGAASGVATDGATVSGTVDPGGATSTYRFEYGTSTSYGLTSPTQTLAADAPATTVSAPLTKLTSGTTYHYRLTATNAAGVTNGADRTLRTAATPRAPSVSTGTAASITRTTATLRGGVDPNGQPTQAFFEYGTSTAYGSATPVVDAGAGGATRAIAIGVGALQPGTTYHFRVVASSPIGVTRGADRTFTTSREPISIAIGAAPDPVSWGQPLTIEGRLAGTGIARRSVELQSTPFPFTRGFRKVSTHLTSAAGVVRFTVAPFPAATRFRLAGAGTKSAVVTVEVRPLLGLSVRRVRGRRVRISGEAHPAQASGLVSIQRRTATGRFVTLRRVALTPHSGGARYATTIRYRRGLVLRAVLRGENGPLLGARSRVRRVPSR